MNNTTKQKLIITAGIVIVALVGWWIYQLITIKGTVTVYIAPLNGVTLTINDRVYKNVATEKKIAVTSESLDITASRDGFESQTIQYTLNTDRDTNDSVYFVLPPVSDDAKALMNTEDEILNRQFVATEQSLVIATKQRSEHPFLTELPHYDRFFTLSQGISEAVPEKLGAFALYVDYITEDGKQEALQYIKDSGSDPADFEIIYRAEEYVTRDSE